VALGKKWLQQSARIEMKKGKNAKSASGSE
jgi:hypothetical protein